MAENAAAAHDDHGDGHHGVHHYDYVKVWGVLMVLFFISVAGPALEIKWLTLITAFGVAFVKAGIVIKYFMHLTVEKQIVHYFLITSIVFMVLFFAAVAPDVLNHEGTNWENVAAKQEVARGMAAGPDDAHHGEGDHGAEGDHGEGAGDHGEAGGGEAGGDHGEGGGSGH